MQSHSSMETHQDIPQGLIDDQRKRIKDSIEHFFIDLPQEQKAFIAAAQEIRKAFFGKLDPSNPFFDFQKCIHKATTYLRGVDTEHHENITLGQVQRYAFNYTKRRLRSLAKQRNIKFSKLGWDTQPLHQLIKHKDFNVKFVSQKLAVDGEILTEGSVHTSEIKLPAGVIYQAKLLPPENEPADDPYTPTQNYASLQVDIILDDGDFPYIESETKKKFKKLPYFRNDQEQDQFWLKSKEEASLKAIEIASNYVIDHLDLETEEEISFGCRKVMTYKYYYNALSCDELDFDLIAYITDYEADILTDPDIIYLQEQHKLTIEDAVHLSRYQAKVIKFFMEKILSGEYSINNFNDLRRSECENLLLPPIKHLTSKKMITLDEAIHMTHGAGKILCDKDFFELAKKNKDFFNIIKDATNANAENLLNKNIQNAIEKNQLTISDVMEENIVFLSHCFSNRLAAILEEKPLQANDTANTIKQEIHRASQDKNFSEKLLLRLTMKKLLVKIKKLCGDDQSSLASELRQEITAAEEQAAREVSTNLSADKWQAAFNKVMGIAHRYLQEDSEEPSNKRAKTSPMFFTPKNTSAKPEDHKSFCQRLSQLASLTRLSERPRSEGRNIIVIKRRR